jgi:hypothetical protein
MQFLKVTLSRDDGLSVASGEITILFAWAGRTDNGKD